MKGGERLSTEEGKGRIKLQGRVKLSGQWAVVKVKKKARRQAL